jgi:hypothetical protein
VDAAAVTAIVAVGVSGVVGVTAVIVPAAVRRGDRQHERQMKIHDERAKAYTRSLEVMEDWERWLRGIAAGEEPGGDPELPKDIAQQLKEMRVLVWLWGSREVRELWNRRADLETALRRQPASVGAWEVYREAANAVRQRMSDELQGRA